MLSGAVTVEGSFRCPVVVVVALIFARQVSEDQCSPNLFVRSYRSLNNSCRAPGWHCPSWLWGLPCWQECQIPRKSWNRWVVPTVLGIEALALGSRGFLLVRRGSANMGNLCLSHRFQFLVFIFLWVWFLALGECRFCEILRQHRGSADGRSQVPGHFGFRCSCICSWDARWAASSGFLLLQTK